MNSRRVTILKKEISLGMLAWWAVGLLAAVALVILVFYQAAVEDPAEPYFRCVYQYYGPVQQSFFNGAGATEPFCGRYKPQDLTPDQAWAQFQTWLTKVEDGR